MKGIIAGIDPGTTGAVCVLDLNGNVLGVKSGKGFSETEIIRYLCSFGSPIVIAVDVRSIPQTVQKIAQRFCAMIEAPEQNVSTREKDRLYNRYLEKGGEALKNQHEKDALVAALLVYYSYQNKLRQIDKKAGPQSDEVKRAVMQGKKIKDVLSNRNQTGIA